MLSRKILLFSDDEPWVKKDNEDDFDVPMNYCEQKCAS